MSVGHRSLLGQSALCTRCQHLVANWLRHAPQLPWRGRAGGADPSIVAAGRIARALETTLAEMFAELEAEEPGPG